MIRPDWSEKKTKPVLDLSKNVHYDSILFNLISSILSNQDLHDYPLDIHTYEAISLYYNIPVKNIAIGYGSSEVIERVLRALNIKNLYILVPTFEMVPVYCTNNNINYTFISCLDEAVDSSFSLYIVNPNGNNGSIMDLTNVYTKFQYCIVDEVYADFDNSYSLLNVDTDNVIIIKSLSKSLGVAGFRIGFCKASTDIIYKIQLLRHSYVTSSLVNVVIPKIIFETPNVISRMKNSKNYLESKYECVESHANYVLFKHPNILTDTYGYKVVDGLYRMALLDINLILKHV